MSTNQTSLWPDAKHLQGSCEYTPLFSFDGQNHVAFCTEVYDGDSITVAFDTFGTVQRHKVRVVGVDTPEIRGGTPETKAAAVSARDFVRSLVHGKICMLHCEKFDKYGRLLARVGVDVDGVEADLSELILAGGYGYSYDGGAKRVAGE